MNKFLKIAFFICVSYIFSLKVTKIKPTTVSLGEYVSFILTDKDKDQNYRDFNFGLGDKREKIKLNCNKKSYSNENELTCSTYITFSKNSLYDLKKNLYINNIKTNLTVTIKMPSSLKLVKTEEIECYSYSICYFEFRVNYNKFSVYLKLGDIVLDDCENSFYYIECYYYFDESYEGKQLYLELNGVKTNYSVNIIKPPEFSYINDFIFIYYFKRSTPQYVSLCVDSFYKMNDHEIVMVPETSGNKNITLTGCTYDFYDISFAKCLGILDTIDTYKICVDGKCSEEKIFVFPATSINRAFGIKPNEILIPSIASTFIFNVDYIINVENAVFTLVDEYNSDNEVYLYNCSTVYDSIDFEFKINCFGIITEAGCYYFYLNGVKKNDIVYAYGPFLTKILNIEPNVIKFVSSNEFEYFKIIFDSMNNISSNNITLKGTKKTLSLELLNNDTYGFYRVKFPAVDTYFVYLNNIQQEISIEVTNKEISKVFSIFPTTIPLYATITYTLTVDSNFVFDNFYLINKNNNSKSFKLSCKPDSQKKTITFCEGSTIYEGEFFLSYKNETKFNNLIVTVKKLPLLISFSPISISSYSNSETIILCFNTNISSYVNKITFVGAEAIRSSCEKISDYVLYCSTVFDKEDKYYITLDGVNLGKYIYVFKDDNFSDGLNYLNLSVLLLLFVVFVIF